MLRRILRVATTILKTPTALPAPPLGGSLRQHMSTLTS